MFRAQNSNVGSYTRSGFVEVLAAQQSPENPDWFQGTADAVRQYLWLFKDNVGCDEYLILSGDHLYRMDYAPFIKAHRDSGADITVSAVPMDEKRATAFGVMLINNTGRVTDFGEKPKARDRRAAFIRFVVTCLVSLFLSPQNRAPRNKSSGATPPC